MFRFMALELVHWDYWERVMLPSTSRLSPSSVPMARANHAARRHAHGPRPQHLAQTFLPDLRPASEPPYAWLRAVVTNQRDHRGRRPFFPLTTDQVTLACRIMRRSGEWQRQYRIEPGDVGVHELSAQEERFLGVQEYRHRERQGA